MGRMGVVVVAAVCAACGRGGGDSSDKAGSTPAEQLAPLAALADIEPIARTQVRACPYVRGKLVVVERVTFKDERDGTDQPPAVSAATLTLPVALRPTALEQVGTIADVMRSRRVEGWEHRKGRLDQDVKTHYAEDLNVTVFDRATGKRISEGYLGHDIGPSAELDAHLAEKLNAFLRGFEHLAIDAAVDERPVAVQVSITVTKKHRTRVDVISELAAALLQTLGGLDGVTAATEPAASAATAANAASAMALELHLGVRIERIARTLECTAQGQVGPAGVPASTDPLANPDGPSQLFSARAAVPSRNGDAAARACVAALAVELEEPITSAVRRATTAAVAAINVTCRR